MLPTPAMPWLTDRRLLAAALLAWSTMAVLGVVLGPSLGHDEAAFALTARGGAPPGVWLYRSDGTVEIARLGIALGGAVWQLRLASAVLGTGVVIAVFAVGRAAFDARTGAWAAALIAGAHPMVLRSAELLSDLPRWRIAWAGPIFAAAFYARYGSAPVVAVAIAAAALVWWRAVAARPLRVLAMVVALAVLVIPHLIRSFDATGSPLGILRVSAGMPRRAYVGEGLVTYLTSNPLMFYGFLIAPVAIAGLVGLARVRRRAPWYLAIIAIAQLVSLGLQSHGQPRYVYVATALFVVLGVDRVARLDWPRLARLDWSRVALVLVCLAWLGAAIAVVLHDRYNDNERAPIREAARVIRAHTGDRPCAAVALIVPQLMWHSGCQVFASGLLKGPLPADRNRYAVSFTRWPIDLASIVAAQHLRATPLPTADPRTTVWLLQ
jgi:hypothetical protein